MDISTKDIPEHIQTIIKRLVDAGHSAEVVGGAVRDILLGQKPKDFDVITSAHPNQVKKLFKRCYVIGKRFRLALVHTHHPRHQVTEVATYRDSGGGSDDDVLYENSGRMLTDNAFGTIDTDAMRRDFTINALYYDLVDDRIIDKVGGLEDISKRQVRMIGPSARQRLREDPLRAVRAVRIATHNGIDIEAELAQCLPESRPWLDDIPRARIGLELSKIFASRNAREILSELARYQLLDAMVPDIVADMLTQDGDRAMHALFKIIDDHVSACYAERENAGVNAARDGGADSGDDHPGPDSKPIAAEPPASEDPADKTTTGDYLVFPKHQAEELRYAAFYLPLLLKNCADGIDSFESVLDAISIVNPQITCPTIRDHRRGMVALWRTLPRVSRLKPGQMRRFSEHPSFPGTWFLYRAAVEVGLWGFDETTEKWQEYLSKGSGLQCINSIRARNKRVALAENPLDPAQARYTGGGDGKSQSGRRRARGGRRRRGGYRAAGARQTPDSQDKQ